LKSTVSLTTIQTDDIIIIGGETVSTGSMNLKERAEVPEPR